VWVCGARLYGGLIPAGDKKLHDVAEMVEGSDGDGDDADGGGGGANPALEAAMATLPRNVPLYPGTSYYAIQRNAHAQLYGLDAWDEARDRPKPLGAGGDGALADWAAGEGEGAYQLLGSSQDQAAAAEHSVPALETESFRDRKQRLAASRAGGGGAGRGVMVVGGAASAGALVARERGMAAGGQVLEAEEDPAAWQPPISPGEKDLIVVWKNTSITSRSGANVSWSSLVPLVVPRDQLQAHGGAEHAHLLAEGPPPSRKQMLMQRDAAGNTVRSLIVSSQKHTRTLAVPQPKAPVKRTRAERQEARLARTALVDSRLTALQLVEKYRPKIEEVGALQLTGAARQTALIARAARRSKGRKTSATLLSDRGRSLLERGVAVPKNIFIPRAQYRRMSEKLQKKYERAKAEARAQGDDITPKLVKAREALRFMAGTRNDVIATGARFGKRAEYREARARQDRSRGRRRAPEGFMHRSRGGT